MSYKVLINENGLIFGGWVSGWVTNSASNRGSAGIGVSRVGDAVTE